ncbi:MAG: nitroreductase family protein [FCB group bacterium]|nr:nitroreductase family protein [FCB group bacterium]
MLKDLLLKNRSYRRFAPEPVLSEADMYDLVEAARLSPSARNEQAVRFIPVNSQAACNTLFPLCAWAGYLRDWEGPAENERPTCYLIVLVDTRINDACDTDIGIMSQSILLRTVEKGFGGCMLGSIDREAIRKAFSIEEYYIIRYVIAFGKPCEKVVIEDMKNDDVHYYRDDMDVHHVPKRGFDALIIRKF